MTDKIGTTPAVRPGGLVTVAYLKARLDQGSDHLGMFMPLILDVIGSLPNRMFTVGEIQEALASRHGVAMPHETVRTLLKRATQKHYLIREGGGYRHGAGEKLPASNLSQDKAAIEQGQAALGRALQAHAAARGFTIKSHEEALDVLLEFMEKEQVSLLLGTPPAVSSAVDDGQRQRSIVAEFIQDLSKENQLLVPVLRGMLEGLVLYHAAFLPDLGLANRSFKDLSVAFDSVLVRQALGYEGVAMRTLMRETIALLKGCNVHCFVFDTTVQEIHRILTMYESRIGTEQARQSLRQVPMSRHFLAKHYSPGDIREMNALLESDIQSAGFQIRRLPDRTKEYTAGETNLAKRFARPDTKDQMEPRVLHDVDCVAGVLSLRKGQRSSAIENVGVVFATSSPLVIRNARLWWEEDEHENGIPPIVHIRALASLAWLKKPSLCSDYKLRELVALSAAALRPSLDTWTRFLGHLESLLASNRLTSDEVTAILVSAMSDRLLTEAEMEEDDPNDIDAHTLDEIIERVRLSYGAKVDEEVLRVRGELESELAKKDSDLRGAEERAQQAERTAAEEKRRRELQLERRARSWARRITLYPLFAARFIAFFGGVALIIGHPFHGGWVGIAIGTTVVLFVLIEFLGVLRFISESQAMLEEKVTGAIRKWLEGEEQDEGDDA